MIERTTAANAPTKMCQCISLSHCQCLSLLCCPKKSRGSTIPRPLQLWCLLEAEDSTQLQRVKLDLTLSGAATAQGDKIKIKQAPLSSKISGGEVKASHRASVAACGCGYLSWGVLSISGTHSALSSKSTNVCDHTPDLTRLITNSQEHSLNGLQLALPVRVGAPHGFPCYARSLFDVDFAPWVSLAGPGYRVVYFYGWPASNGRPIIPAVRWTYDNLSPE